jgi:hypothetical protein
LASPKIQSGGLLIPGRAFQLGDYGSRTSEFSEEEARTGPVEPSIPFLGPGAGVIFEFQGGKRIDQGIRK